jgi:hypothetical protein
MNSIMTLLKPLKNPNMLIPYEQYYIQTLYREGILIPEQSSGEINPLFQTAINPQPPQATCADQLCFSLQHGHYSNPAATNLQHTTNRGVQTQIHITKYINNAPNYQSTNETYYTQENTMNTKHKRKRPI